MTDIKKQLEGMSPGEQLEVMATLLSDVSETMHKIAVSAKAEAIIKHETTERRERPRDDPA